MIFGNVEDMLFHQQIVVDEFFDLQRKQHPTLISIAGLLKKTAASFNSFFHLFVANTPIRMKVLKYEVEQNQALGAFLQSTVRTTFINFLSEN